EGRCNVASAVAEQRRRVPRLHSAGVRGAPRTTVHRGATPSAWRRNANVVLRAPGRCFGSCPRLRPRSWTHLEALTRDMRLRAGAIHVAETRDTTSRFRISRDAIHIVSLWALAVAGPIHD